MTDVKKLRNALEIILMVYAILGFIALGWAINQTKYSKRYEIEKIDNGTYYVKIEIFGDSEIVKVNPPSLAKYISKDSIYLKENNGTYSFTFLNTGMIPIFANIYVISLLGIALYNSYVDYKVEMMEYLERKKDNKNNKV